MPKPASTRPAYKMLTCIYLCRTLLFFAPYADFSDKKECIDIVRLICNRPLNLLTPEEDFILGTMLGYDVCQQCERYNHRKTLIQSA